LQLTGAAQIFLGTSLLWGHSVYYGIVQNKLWAPAAILLCLGPVTFILCWMGCQATNQRKRCLLGMVMVMLGLLQFHRNPYPLDSRSLPPFWLPASVFSSSSAAGRWP